MIKLGLFCGGCTCCALLSGVLWLGGGAAVEASDEVAQCGSAAVDIAADDVELTPVEQKLVTRVADLFEAGKQMMSEEELMEEVGLSAEQFAELDEARLRTALAAELTRRGFDLASLGGNCTKYSACSVDHNLSNATGEELARYQKEVALDGASFSDRVAPDFTLPDTEGRQVSLSDYRGSDVAVVFLSAHCYHSLDTLPILAELKKKYAEQDLVILPVFINSGTVEELASRAWELEVDYPLIVSEGKQISRDYDSRMVPSTFLIDERGRLIRKLVGFKDRATLDKAFAELLGS